MKYIKIIILTLCISSSSIFSQIEDKAILSDFEKVAFTNDQDRMMYVEQNTITEEYTPIILDPEDKYKLNQDFIYLPTQIIKEIRVDVDKDISFDKKVKLTYLKPKKIGLDFLITKEGILVKTENKYLIIEKIVDKNDILHTTVNNKIDKKGDYTIYLNSGDKIDVNIIDYQMIK